MDMNFFTDKVIKFNEKKLNDAIQKLKFHQEIKKHLETTLKSIDDKSDHIKKEIIKQNDIIDIWEKNIIKIKEQLEKLSK
jgi:septal ring factor EnvC (AmiA/AmiB activator)